MDDSIKIEYLNGGGCSYTFYDVAYPDIELGQLNLIREHGTVVNKDGIEIYIVAYDIDNLMQAIKRTPPTCLRVVRFVKILETTGKEYRRKEEYIIPEYDIKSESNCGEDDIFFGTLYLYRAKLIGQSEDIPIQKGKLK